MIYKIHIHVPFAALQPEPCFVKANSVTEAAQLVANKDRYVAFAIQLGLADWSNGFLEQDQTDFVSHFVAKGKKLTKIGSATQWGSSTDLKLANKSQDKAHELAQRDSFGYPNQDSEVNATLDEFFALLKRVTKQDALHWTSNQSCYIFDQYQRGILSAAAGYDGNYEEAASVRLMLDSGDYCNIIKAATSLDLPKLRTRIMIACGMNYKKQK